MKPWKFLVLVACLVAWAWVSFGLIAPSVQHTNNIYGGQKVFLSQEAYEVFKSDVKNRVYGDNLGLNSFDVLASEPPIIVNFSITVPYDYEFPYGESQDPNLDWILITALALIASLLLIVAPLSLIFGQEGGN